MDFYLMTKNFKPVQTLLLGYLVIIFSGAVLLCTPLASSGYQGTSFLDALFTSASAVSTTGLGVVDTGTHFSVFGQIVILILIQIGGLGYMIFIAFVSIRISYRFTITSKKLLTESIARPTSIEIKKFVKAVIRYTFVFELIGAIALTIVFSEHVTIGEAAYSAAFHSVSAFCTAGFSLYTDSFTAYSYNISANIIIAIITIAGGIGFFVLYDLSKYFSFILTKRCSHKLSAHSKLVLIVSSLLIAAGTIVLFLSEGPGEKSISWTDKFLTSSFQAISASSTTGFNTVDIGTMQALSLFVIIILMFIGASPGGTGGGIKTSTFGIIILFIKKVILNREDVSAFRRTIDKSTVNKALGITLLGVFYVITVFFLLSISENASLLKIIFEITSAIGTVGLSMGITPALSSLGKLLIIITMLVGRVGPLAIGYSLIGKTKTIKFTYPNGNVMTG
jgi:trk system potassium uptake protein TrkH